MKIFSVLLLFALSCVTGRPETNLIGNNGFESGLQGWRPFWSRESGAGKASLDRQETHSGTNSLHIEHTGKGDWSIEPETRIPAQPGDIFELAAAVKLSGTGSGTLCVSLWDKSGNNMGWSHGSRNIHETKQWTILRSRFVVPPGVTQIQPRIIGYGPCVASLDDCSLIKHPGVNELRLGKMPQDVLLTNGFLKIQVHAQDATLSIQDLRTKRTWNQKALHSDMLITGLKSDPSLKQVQIKFLDVPSGLTLTGLLAIDASRPEFTLALSSTGELGAPLRFPHPFTTESGDWLVVPMNEGISYPVEDSTINPMRLIAYGGHGICMAFWGVTDGRQGQGVIIETPDDASIQISRIEKKLAIAAEWDPQKGQFGYERTLRYIFFDQGGHVAMAKRYREYAKKIGLFKTLETKRQENPNVDLLIGAVNVWTWDRNPVPLAREMQAAGIERMLWSGGGTPESLKTMNEMKILTSRYDIYQDVMDPANFSKLSWVHGDWVTEAWPQDIVQRSDGRFLTGWGVEGKAGDWYYCGVICDTRAVKYARLRIPSELATRPYQCRFIDTTTAAPWNECYNTNHPMTRTESRQNKMKLLEYVSKDMKLVTGCETGHDASVPFLHYFEGMLSLGPYRVPDAGRDMQRIWDTVPEQVAKFQLGQNYRLPLWELVYHDCVVAQWYWGDYNNKLPSLWNKRDLFNLLYGTPPMFMFNQKLWETEKDRFVQSFRNTCPYVRDVGYSEMTDHRFLTPDRNVQQTHFSNGTTITVNFGDAPYTMESGDILKPSGFKVIKTETK